MDGGTASLFLGVGRLLCLAGSGGRQGRGSTVSEVLCGLAAVARFQSLHDISGHAAHSGGILYQELQQQQLG